jgi:TM2 domain-containing membrane protein YozV
MKKIIVCLLALSFYAAAQDKLVLEKQFAFAKDLQSQGQLFDAVTEYERLLCFDTLHQYGFDANKNIAACYRRGAKYKEAVTYAGASLKYAKNRDDIHETKIELVKLHLLNRTFSSASNILSSMEKDTADKSGEQEIHYWRGWICMFSNEWEKAADEFAFVDSAQSLRQFCMQTEKKQYPVTTLKILSAVIPGSGQMITGHVWNGLLSLGWNALWGYLTVEAAVADRVGDALLIGDLLWLRFYTGNIENAGKFADEKNAQLFQDALRYLQDEFIGAKP